MTTLNRRLFALVALLSLILGASLSFAQANRVLEGELVITDAAHRRFRVVDFPGTYVAPASIGLDPFDGKPVQVTLGADGQVIGIAEKHIDIVPVEHGFEIVSGYVRVVDAAAGTFGFAQDSNTYTAPSGFDIRPYDRHMAEIRLDEKGRVTDIKLIATEPAGTSGGNCTYGGRDYSDGASLCQAGTYFACSAGAWRNLGTTCSTTQQQQAVVESKRNCGFHGVSVVNGSSICDEGRTYRCDNGEWIPLGTTCR